VLGFLVMNWRDRQADRIGSSQWNHDVYDRLEGMLSPLLSSVTGEIRSSRVLPLNGSMTVPVCQSR
jgi:hypothetical protein